MAIERFTDGKMSITVRTIDNITITFPYRKRGIADFPDGYRILQRPGENAIEFRERVEVFWKNRRFLESLNDLPRIRNSDLH